MPELPEVETVRRSLAGKLEGRRISCAEVFLPRLIKWPEAGDFSGHVSRRLIHKLDRRGKYLILQLEGDMNVVIHLRMTGRLWYAKEGKESYPSVHIVFHLDNGYKLLYADTRTLGTLYAMPDKELWRISGLASLGPEPLTPGFTREYFQEMLRKRKAAIKSVLLNQQLVSGLGNIYADEALARAGIHPDRQAASLSVEEAARLHEAIGTVIEQAIQNRGTSFRDYRDGLGHKGQNQEYLLVYGRGGQPCRHCGTPIQKKKTAGRGTHFCPACQPE